MRRRKKRSKENNKKKKKKIDRSEKISTPYLPLIIIKTKDYKTQDSSFPRRRTNTCTNFSLSFFLSVFY